MSIQYKNVLYRIISWKKIRQINYLLHCVSRIYLTLSILFCSDIFDRRISKMKFYLWLLIKLGQDEQGLGLLSRHDAVSWLWSVYLRDSWPHDLHTYFHEQKSFGVGPNFVIVWLIFNGGFLILCWYSTIENRKTKMINWY